MSGAGKKKQTFILILTVYHSDPAPHDFFYTVLHGRRLMMHALLDGVFVAMEEENLFDRLFESPLVDKPLNTILQTLRFVIFSDHGKGK